MREYIFMLDSGDSEASIKHIYRKTEGTKDIWLERGLGVSSEGGSIYQL